MMVLKTDVTLLCSVLTATMSVYSRRFPLQVFVLELRGKERGSQKYSSLICLNLFCSQLGARGQVGFSRLVSMIFVVSISTTAALCGSTAVSPARGSPRSSAKRVMWLLRSISGEEVLWGW